MKMIGEPATTLVASDRHADAFKALAHLTRLQAFGHVVVPQALRRSVPGFQNEFTIVLKDTSVAFAIGLAELLKRSRDLFISPAHGGTAIFEIVLAMSAIYFVLTFATNRGLDWLDAVYAIPTGEGSR